MPWRAFASVRDGNRDALTPRLLDVLDDARDSDGVVTPYVLFGAIVRHGENLGARVLTTMGVELPEPQPRTKGRKANGAGDLDSRAPAHGARGRGGDRDGARSCRYRARRRRPR